jgi:fibro-slime domain-containing protein
MSKARIGGFGSGVMLALFVSHAACSSDSTIADGGAADAGPSQSDAGEDGSATADAADADIPDAAPDAPTPSVCGDGLVEGDEECDDGALVPGDGCGASCFLEPGYECPVAGKACTPTLCGDGLKRGTEQCDDGNNDWADGCTSLCTHAPVCSGGTCTVVCGDGIVSAGEACDDGNNRPQDGCSPTCTVEPGFTCRSFEEAAPATLTLAVVHRDFRGFDLPPFGNLPRGHVDFENKNGAERGIVKSLLGDGGKPAYAKEGSISGTTENKAAFDQWFRDVENVNVPIVATMSLALQPASGAYAFDSDAFFPIDDAGFVAAGAEQKRRDQNGTLRNFSFTSEMRSWFQYKGAEVITIRGDDDIWVFINGHLALDLGGVHGPESGTVTLSQQAAALGLTTGGVYEMAIFRAERHTLGSSFRLMVRPPPRSVCAPAGP